MNKTFIALLLASSAYADCKLEVLNENLIKLDGVSYNYVATEYDIDGVSFKFKSASNKVLKIIDDRAVLGKTSCKIKIVKGK